MVSSHIRGMEAFRYLLAVFINLHLLLCVLPLVSSQHMRPRLPTYHWKTGQWGRCLGNECGFGGHQRRAIWCEHSDGRTADHSDCVATEAPPSQRPCFRVCPEHRHDFQWEVNDWGPCRQNNNLESLNTGDMTSCGPSSFGLQQRTVMCMELATTYVQTNEDGSVPSYICEQFATKPAIVQECITPCAQDCVVTQFSPWSECSKTCGNGTQMRSRRVVIPPSNSGESCPLLSETKVCTNMVECEEEEAFTYSPRVTSWGACEPFSTGRGTGTDDEPVAGTQNRQLACSRSDGKTVRTSQCFRDLALIPPPQHQVCLVPVDCHVSGWSEWSPCSDPCSSDIATHSIRTRSVLRVPVGDGDRCPELVQKRTCSLDPDQCQRGQYVWRTSAWSQCVILPSSQSSDAQPVGNGSCGGGLATRDVFCAHVNDTAYVPLNEHLCDAAKRPNTTTHCHVPCPKPCQVTSWSEWGPCISADCEVPGTKKAKGHISRVRHVISLPENGGTPCAHLTEFAPCNIQRCYQWFIEETTCQPNDAQTMCGEGMMTRIVYCINAQGERTEDESMCRALNNKPNAEVTCEAPCPSDCVLGDWGDWSECTETCEGKSGRGGVQVRYRAILAQPGPGGQPCPASDDLIESRPCNHHSCTLFMWMTKEWGECLPDLDNLDQLITPDEDGRCGMGSQTRNVSCSRILPAKVAPDKRCYEPLRPPSTQECEVTCVQDCLVSEFSDWTPCPTTCPPDLSLSTQERRRYIISLPTNGGLECSTDLKEERTCNLPDSCYTYTWLTSTWTDCQLTGRVVINSDGLQETCGDGLQTRVLQCERSDGSVVDHDVCLQYGPPMPAQSQHCRIACSDDCVMSAWSPWSNCQAHCLGSQTRRRRVHVRSRRQPECMNPDLYPEMETRPCKCPTYRLVQTGTWSDCLLDSDADTEDSVDGLELCGRGVKYRPVVCLDQEDRYVAMSHCGAEQDFTEEHCAIPCPEDCVLNVWSDWRPCSGRTQGGIGVTTRWQEVRQTSTFGGRPCPQHDNNWIDEMKPCRWGAGRQDASWQADEWLKCVVSKVIGTNGGEDCGQGVQRRTVGCVFPIEHGFRMRTTNLSECDASRKPDLVQPCIKHCPGQCVVSSWTEWTPCPEDCSDETYRTRDRRILRHPSDSSSDSPLGCPHLMEREQCIPGINCFTYTWNATEWSPCQLPRDRACGEGVRDRLLQCLRSDGRIVEVTKCEQYAMSAPLSTSTSCEIVCPVDCKLSPFTPWSECSQTCGSDAVMTRHRTITQLPNSKGRPCPSTLTQQKPCKAVPCYEWAITAWGPCTTLIGDCGAGIRKRNVTCRQPNGIAVPDSFCLLTRNSEPYHKNRNITLQGHEYLEREHRCEVPCPGQCHHTTWSQWSICHRTCVQGRPIGSEGIQVRSRASLTMEGICPGDDWETRTCSGELCYEFDWSTGDWERDQRDVWCQRSDGLNVTGGCTHDMPSAIASCNPACHITSSYCTINNRCVCDRGYKPIYSMSNGQLEACLDMKSLPPESSTDPNPALSPKPTRRHGDAGISGVRADGVLNDAGTGTMDGGNQGDGLNELLDDVMNPSWNPQAGHGSPPKDSVTSPPATTKGPAKSFLESLPPWVYAIAAVVVLLIVVVSVVLCCAKCAPRKKEEEKKPEPDYSMYWDETVQKKYTGEIEL